MNLKDYALRIKGKRCLWCHALLKPIVHRYPHKWGWEVEGFEERQWLFTICPRCGYQWSLEKLGIKRDI